MRKQVDINSFILCNTRIKHLHVNSNYNSYLDSFWEKKLYQFFELNRSLESLEGNVFTPEEGLLTIITQVMEEEGIQQGCMIITRKGQERFNSINAVSANINASFPIIKIAFEFYKRMKDSDFLNADVIQMICLVILNLCPEGIFEKNKKGFVKLIKSAGFFSLHKINQVEEEGAKDCRLLINS
ncbi:MAG: hypothetical protein H0U73_03850 [Tatlockia sp.]|nr:hypothetical protein [Tatlockia sp.]